MPLDDLVQVIETLQQRIRDHGDSLRQNEIRTRVALIDPLLTALGWDVSDPGVVTAEYAVAGGRADYALRTSGSIPAATFEAKKLGESLEPHRMQMLNYSNAAGIRYAGLTDGNAWELYEIFRPGTLEERRILEVSIASDSAYQCALQFLLLWRPNLESGRAMPAKGPILSLQEFSPNETESDVNIPPSQLDAPSNEVWQPLSKLQPQPGQSVPSVISFPDGQSRSVRFWYQLPVEVAEFLIRANCLTKESCPIGRKTRYVIHTQAKHSNERPFSSPKELSSGLFIPTHGNARAQVDNAKFLLQHFGQDPSSVHLKFDQNNTSPVL